VCAGAAPVADVLQQTLAKLRTTKPVLAVVMSADGTPSLLRAGKSLVAAFPYPESAARALGLAAERAEWLRRPAGSVRTLDDIDRPRARRIVDEALTGSSEVWLDAGTTRELLEAYGVPVVAERLAADADGAAAAARELGFPVVVKTSAAGVHKSDTGGVVLNLRDEDSVRAAVAKIGGSVVVQQQIVGGAELLAGVVQDPVFGPLVAFGPGGVFAELIGDAAFRIAPLTDVDAEELVSEGKAGRLVRGFRGSPPASSAALVDLVQRLARLADDLPEVAELDLNPVLALPESCVAVDARIRLHARPGGHSLKSW
jgi:acyl-CoA synthetase (NDP forming)